MKSTNNKIIVSVNMKQKDTMKIGDIEVSCAQKYEVNYRHKSPVIAKIESGNKHLRDGSIIVCHHNHFYHPSPYYLYDNLFSIPFNKTIFAIIDNEGFLKPVCGNIIGNRVDIKTIIPLPPEQRKKHTDRIIITDAGWTNYKEGDLIFTRPSAPYDIIYHWNGEQRVIIKVSDDMVCGVIQNKN